MGASSPVRRLRALWKPIRADQAVLLGANRYPQANGKSGALSTGAELGMTRHGRFLHDGGVSAQARQRTAISGLIDEHGGVLSIKALLNRVTREEIRWHVSSGRWQQPC